MKNWKKILACATMGVAAVCLSIFGFAALPTSQTVTAATVSYSNDSSKWVTTAESGIVGFVFKDNAMNIHEAPNWNGVGGYKAIATTKKIGGNVTINMTMAGSINVENYWGYNWIIFQDTSEKFENTQDTDTTVFESTEWTPRRVRDNAQLPANSSGNWLALVYGVSESAVNLYECDSGIVTKIATIASTSDGAYSVHKGETNIKITSTDTQMGVSSVIEYTQNGKTYSYTYVGDNTALWGEQSFSIGYWGNAHCDPPADGVGYTDGTFIYNIDVEESASMHTYESYNNIAETAKWQTTTNISNGEKYLTVSSPNRPNGTSDEFNSYAETKQVGANSTLDLTMTANLTRDTAWDTKQGLWAYDWVLFKNTNDNSGKDWSPNNKTYKGDENEHWLAFAFGASIGSLIYECKGGVVNSYPVYMDSWAVDGISDTGNMSGYDVWYTYAQTTHMKIVTKDTETGVFVKLTYYAENCTKYKELKDEEGNITTTDEIVQNTGHVYEFTYVSTNTNLWGKQSYVIGHYGNGKFDSTENYHYDMRIMSSESTFTNNIAGNPEHWDLENSYNGVSNVTSQGDGGMRFNQGEEIAAMLLKKNIKADSTIDLVVKGNANTDGTYWANMFIMFKNVSETRDPASLGTFVDRVPIQSGEDQSKITGTVRGYVYKPGTTEVDTSQNWLGVYFGSNSKNFDIYECVNGEVTYTTSYWSGNDTWYFGHGQTSELTITTTDNLSDGTVTVKFEWNASGSTHTSAANRKMSYIYTTKASNTFLGDYGFSVGLHSKLADGQYIDLADMAVYDKDANHSEAGATQSGMYIQDNRGASLSMEGDIAVNFYMALAPSVWKDSAAQVDFYIDGELFASDFLSATDTQVINGTNCYKISCGIPPKDYQKSIRVLLALRENIYVVYEGQVIDKYINETKGDSSATAETKNAVNAMEAYCEASREYFSTGTVTEPTEKVDMEAVNDSKYSMTFKPWNTTLDLDPYSFGFYGLSLILEDTISLRFYVQTDNIDNYKVSFDMDTSDDDYDKYATIMKNVGTWTRWYDDKYSDVYYIDIKGIDITDIDKNFTITVERQDDSARGTFTCSVFGYMQTILNATTPSQKDITLMQYMYAYYTAATEYNKAIEASNV